MIRPFERVLTSGIAIVLLATIAAAAATAPDYTGVYSDANLTLTLASQGSDLTGTLNLRGTAYPAQAHSSENGLHGTFIAGASQFEFNATLAGDQLTLSSGGKTYQLQRKAINPLSGLAGDGGDSRGHAAASPGPAGFEQLGSTANGKALYIKLSDAKSLVQAITQTCDHLASVFGEKPTVGSAFADGKTHGRGGALFTAHMSGQDIRGWVFAGMEASGGTASVVYASASAPQAEVATLFAMLPAKTQMQEHKFPDGSGSIDLPPGWTTTTTSLGMPLVVKGPGKQTVFAGIIISALCPDGMLMKTAQQTYQMKLQNYQMMMNMWQRSGRMGPPPPQPGLPPDPDRDFPSLLFCPYCRTPDEVMAKLYPKVNDSIKKAGKPWDSLDKIVSERPADPTPNIANANAAQMLLLNSAHEQNAVTSMKSLVRVECYPVLDGSSQWTANFSGAAAPAETFDRDMLLMNAIYESVKVDPDWLQAKIKSDGERIRQQGEQFHQQLLAQGRAFQQQQDDQFNRFEAQNAAQQKAMHDSSSDFIEMIRGTRDVYDTATGTMHSVDYNNVDGIVNGMNEAASDPGRFVQVPLREER